MPELNSRLEQCFKAVFPALNKEEINNASLKSVVDWDSISAINLVTVIEEEFEIQVAPDDVPILSSFKAILDYLKNSHRIVAFWAIFRAFVEISSEGSVVGLIGL